MDMLCTIGSVAAVILLTMLSSIFDQVFGQPFPPRRKLEPRFLPTPTNITVHQGEMAVLKCHIKDLGPKIVVWRKKGVDAPLTIGGDTFVEEDQMSIGVEKINEQQSHWDLLIKNVQLHHAGTYLCQVTASKLYTHYVSLHVLEEPIHVDPDIVIAGTEYVNQGQYIKLTCNATGAIRAPLEVDWFFYGERIISTQKRWRDRTRILKRTKDRSFISDLIVERSTLEDNGNYVCRSTDVGPVYEVTSIFVNVLSAGKEPVGKRDKANLSHSSDLTSSTLIFVPQLTVTLCGLSLFIVS